MLLRRTDFCFYRPRASFVAVRWLAYRAMLLDIPSAAREHCVHGCWKWMVFGASVESTVHSIGETMAVHLDASAS